MFPYGSHAARRSLIPFVADFMSRLDVADFTLQTLRLRLYVTDFTSQASRRCQTLRRRLHVADFTRRDFTPQTLCRGLYVADFALQRLHMSRLCVADFTWPLRRIYMPSLRHLDNIWTPRNNTLATNALSLANADFLLVYSTLPPIAQG